MNVLGYIVAIVFWFGWLVLILVDKVNPDYYVETTIAVISVTVLGKGAKPAGRAAKNVAKKLLKNGNNQ